MSEPIDVRAELLASLRRRGLSPPAARPKHKRPAERVCSDCGRPLVGAQRKVCGDCSLERLEVSRQKYAERRSLTT